MTAVLVCAACHVPGVCFDIRGAVKVPSNKWKSTGTGEQAVFKQPLSVKSH